MLLSSSCTPKHTPVPKTKFVTYIPEPAPRPSKPNFEDLNNQVGIDDVENFKKLQRNFVRLVRYSNLLHAIVVGYEVSYEQAKPILDKFSRGELKKEEVDKLVEELKKVSSTEK